MSPTLGVFSPLWTVFHCSVSKESNGEITGGAIDNTFASSCVSACLLIANAVRFRSVFTTIFLAIVLAKFLFPFDPRHVIPPRNNALALRRGGPRPLDIPLPFTGTTGAAGVSALNLVPNWS